MVFRDDAESRLASLRAQVAGSHEKEAELLRERKTVRATVDQLMEEKAALGRKHTYVGFEGTEHVFAAELAHAEAARR